jgi:hypothetical protein
MMLETIAYKKACTLHSHLPQRLSIKPTNIHSAKDKGRKVITSIQESGLGQPQG